MHKFNSGKTPRIHRALDDTLISICLAKPPRRYLEIGTREGGSLVAVLKHSNPAPEFIAICDTWGNSHGGTQRGNHSHIQEILDGINYQGEVTWLDGNSLDLIPTLQQTFDLILIDGDHSIKGARADLNNCWPLLEESSFLVMDDVMTHKKKIKKMCNNFRKRHDNVKFLHINKRKPGNLVLQKKS